MEQRPWDPACRHILTLCHQSRASARPTPTRTRWGSLREQEKGPHDNRNTTGPSVPCRRGVLVHGHVSLSHLEFWGPSLSLTPTPTFYGSVSPLDWAMSPNRWTSGHTGRRWWASWRQEECGSPRSRRVPSARVGERACASSSALTYSDGAPRPYLPTRP